MKVALKRYLHWNKTTVNISPYKITQIIKTSHSRGNLFFFLFRVSCKCPLQNFRRVLFELWKLHTEVKNIIALHIQYKECRSLRLLRFCLLHVVRFCIYCHYQRIFHYGSQKTRFKKFFFAYLDYFTRRVRTTYKNLTFVCVCVFFCLFTFSFN